MLSASGRKMEKELMYDYFKANIKNRLSWAVFHDLLLELRRRVIYKEPLLLSKASEILKD